MDAKKSKETYIVDVYDSYADTQFDGVPKGMQFYFDDFGKANSFVGDMILIHKKFVMFGIKPSEG
jgi:hypothetical protein